MAIEYKGVLYLNKDYKKKKREESKVKSKKVKAILSIYFVDDNLKLWEWTLISEKDLLCSVRVKERISGVVKECEILKKDLRFERF